MITGKRFSDIILMDLMHYMLKSIKNINNIPCLHYISSLHSLQNTTQSMKTNSFF